MFAPGLFPQPSMMGGFGMPSGGMMHVGHPSMASHFSSMSFLPRAQESARQRAPHQFTPNAPLSQIQEKPSPPQLPPIPTPDCPPSRHIPPSEDTWKAHLDPGYIAVPAREYVQATAWPVTGDPSVFLQSTRKRSASQPTPDAPQVGTKPSPRSSVSRPLRGPRACLPIPKPPVVGVDSDSDEHATAQPIGASAHSLANTAGPARKGPRSPSTAAAPNQIPRPAGAAVSGVGLSSGGISAPASQQSSPCDAFGGSFPATVEGGAGVHVCAVPPPRNCKVYDACRTDGVGALCPAEPMAGGVGGDVAAQARAACGKAVLGPGARGLCELQLRVVLGCGSTGFESTKEFEQPVGTLLAGQYEILGELGRAAFSRAYKAIDRANGRVVCVKAIVNRKEFFDQSLDEIKLLHYISEHGGNYGSPSSASALGASGGGASGGADGDIVPILNSSPSSAALPLGKPCTRVVCMYDYFYTKEHLCLVTELLGPSLYDAVLVRPFPLRRLKRIVAQTLSALAHIHSLGLLHCDVKPENVLFEAPTPAAVAAHPPPLHEISVAVASASADAGVGSGGGGSVTGGGTAGTAGSGSMTVTRHVDPDAVKLIDFGSSCFATDKLSSYVQSRSYRAPEVILGLPYDGRIDIFSLGTMLPELVTGGPPLLHNRSLPQMLARMTSLFGPFPPEMLSAAPHGPAYFTSPTGPVYEATAGDPSYDGVELLLPTKTSWAASVE